MTNSSRVRDIKHAQRESFLLKEISSFFMQIVQDDPQLSSLFINRVSLSPDRGSVTIYFYTPDGLSAFEQRRKALVLYKPSLRSALSKVMHSRYVPELRFAFDQQYEKQQRVEGILEDLKREDKF